MARPAAKTGPTSEIMRRYTCIIDQRSDGLWVAYYPAVAEIPPITVATKRQAKKQSFRALISFLHQCRTEGEPLPKDTSTTCFHKVDINKLDRYPSQTHEPKDFLLR